MKPPVFVITKVDVHELGHTKITLWDRANTEILDCWVIEDHHDFNKCAAEVQELMQ